VMDGRRPARRGGQPSPQVTFRDPHGDRRHWGGEQDALLPPAGSVTSPASPRRRRRCGARSCREPRAGRLGDRSLFVERLKPSVPRSPTPTQRASRGRSTRPSAPGFGLAAKRPSCRDRGLQVEIPDDPARSPDAPSWGGAVSTSRPQIVRSTEGGRAPCT
jgi:hypothetical protein